MAIERQRLREELVAMFAAARELSPEYDPFLADIYLDTAYGRQRALPRPTPLFAQLKRMGPLLGAAALALAALIFSLLVLQADPGPPANGFIFGPGVFGHHRFHDWDDRGWYGPVSPPPVQAPSPPSSSPAPNV
jgi:hypothetical protein